MNPIVVVAAAVAVIGGVAGTKLNKKRRKRSSIICAMCFTLLIGLAACGESPEEQSDSQQSSYVPADKQEIQLINISFGPEIELIVDEEGNVITASASNEEGNIFLIDEDFTEKTAEHALAAIEQVATQSGYLEPGDSMAQEVADIEQLRELAALCIQNLEPLDLQAMEQGDILELLIRARQDTVGILSQELKVAYYYQKPHEARIAEMIVFRDALFETENAFVQALSSQFITVVSNYRNAVSRAEEMRSELLLEEESPYQTALAHYCDVKTAWLNMPQEERKNLQTDLNDAESALQAEYDNAYAELSTEFINVDNEYDALSDMFESFQDRAQDILNANSTKMDEAREQTESGYREAFCSANVSNMQAAEVSWQAMKTALAE